jgi:hypothetical protein
MGDGAVPCDLRANTRGGLNFGYEFGEAKDFGIPQFRHLPAGNRVALPKLIELDGIGLVSNLLAVALAVWYSSESTKCHRRPAFRKCLGP